jgi:hypothetical protein
MNPVSRQGHQAALPRAYRCHSDLAGTPVPVPRPHDETTTASAEAIEWIRHSVRAVAWQCDSSTFDNAWAWLGRHRAMHEGVRQLRRGRPFAFELTSQGAMVVDCLPRFNAPPRRGRRHGRSRSSQRHARSPSAHRCRPSRLNRSVEPTTSGMSALDGGRVMSSARCVDCGVWHTDALMVGQAEAGSGAGAIYYACPEHARERAQRVDAPTWLRKVVAEVDAREATDRAQLVSCVLGGQFPLDEDKRLKSRTGKGL